MDAELLNSSTSSDDDIATICPSNSKRIRTDRTTTNTATTSTTTTTNTNTTTTTMSNLIDDLLINIMQYLTFWELIHSVSMLSKRLHKFRDNSHSLYSVKNYPIRRRDSHLMEKYCRSLIQTKKTETFIWRHIKELKWMKCPIKRPRVALRGNAGTLERIRRKLTITAVLFKNLHSLQYLTIWGLTTTLIEHLPMQNNLQSLCIRSESASMKPPTKLLAFLNKSCAHSFRLLKQLYIDQFTATTDLLNTFSKMVHLEVFKFNEIRFCQEEYEDGIITETLLKDTFAGWNDIHTLDIFDIEMESGRSTFREFEPHFWLLQTLLSFKTLRSLKVGISPQNASINRILPYFKPINELHELHLSVTAANLKFNQQIVKTIGCQQLNCMSVDFCSNEDYGDLDSNSFILECIAMTTHVFNITLPVTLPDDETNSKRLESFRRFVKGIETVNISIQELQMELHCFANLVEITQEFAVIAKCLSKTCRAIGCKVEIRLMYYGAGVFTDDDQWNYIRHTLACAGFLAHRNHPNVPSNCLFSYCYPQSERFNLEITGIKKI